MVKPEIPLQIITATVIINKDSCDNVYLHTNLPCPFTKEADPSQAPLTFEFRVPMFTGVDYVKRYFDIEPRVIKT